MQLTRLAEREGETAVVAERNRMAREIHDTLAIADNGQGFDTSAGAASLYAVSAPFLR